MHPGRLTEVAVRAVRTVTWFVPSFGVKRSWPTTEWSLANACNVHVGCVVPSEMRTSTRAVAEWASMTCQPTSWEWTFGVASTNAAHASHVRASAAATTTIPIVTGRRQAGGGA